MPEKRKKPARAAGYFFLSQTVGICENSG